MGKYSYHHVPSIDGDRMEPLSEARGIVSGTVRIGTQEVWQSKSF